MYSTFVAVDLDPQPEGVEDGSLQLRVGVCQGLGQVGEGGEHRAGVLGIDGRAVAPRLIELVEGGLGLLALGLEDADALADDDRVDTGLDRGKLALDLPVDLAELAGDLLAGAVAARLLVAGEGAAFGLEVTDRLRAEDPGGEEGAERQGREPVRG